MWNGIKCSRSYCQNNRSHDFWRSYFPSWKLAISNTNFEFNLIISMKKSRLYTPLPKYIPEIQFKWREHVKITQFISWNQNSTVKITTTSFSHFNYKITALKLFQVTKQCRTYLHLFCKCSGSKPYKAYINPVYQNPYFVKNSTKMEFCVLCRNGVIRMIRYW